MLETTSVVPSYLSHHGLACCRRAHAWFTAFAVARRQRGERPPSWLRNEFEWGPHRWPHYWCQISPGSTQDCGAFASLTRAAFAAYGVDTVAVQLLENFPERTRRDWCATWTRAGIDPAWCAGPSVYHEAVGLIDSGVLRIWDPLECSFRSFENGYGQIVGLRVHAEWPASGVSGNLNWDGVSISIGEWVSLSEPLRSTPREVVRLGPGDPSTRDVARALLEGWDAVAAADPRLRLLHSSDSSTSSVTHLRLFASCASADVKQVEVTLGQLLSQPTVIVLRCSEGGRVIGAAFARSDLSLETRIGSLDMVAVSSEERRSGVGRALVDAAVRELKLAGCEIARGELMARNQAAATFWRTAGWEDLYSVKQLWFGDTDA